MRKPKLFLVIPILVLITQACNVLSSPTPAPTPTLIVEVVSTPTDGSIPLSEADVPRISLEKAKAAIESGAAIVIDVRSREAFAESHIPGALNIQLTEFETNPTALGLDKDQWIITYCT